MDGSNEPLIAGLFILIGLFAVAGGILNWSWFMGSRKAQFIRKIFGETGTRVFYVIIGLLIITMGVLTLMGHETISFR